MEFRSFVVRVRTFLYLQYCSTDLLYMCSAKKKRTTGTGRGTHHGHCKGNSSTGTPRTRTKALRAKSTHLLYINRIKLP